MKETLGILSVVFGCAGFAPYFWSIFKNRTKPHALTWVVWTMLDGIVFVAQLQHNAGAGLWSTGFAMIACSIVAIISLVQGEKNIKKSDAVAFITALLAIVLWQLTNNALLAVILAAATEFLSFYPTFRKSYTRPDQETVILYVLDSMRHMFAMAALEKFSLINALYPATVIITNVAFVGMVLWRRRVALQVPV